MANADREIHSSLQTVNKNVDKVEKRLLNSFIKYAPQDSVAFNNFWNWLTLAQHHSLPTRLIDWTYSPLIALHFALENFTNFNDDKDAVIWSVDLGQIAMTLSEEALAEFNKEGIYTFQISVLNRLWSSIDELTSNTAKDIMIFFEPPSFDHRIINQYALLSTTRDPNTNVSDWLIEHQHIYKRIIIPANKKWEYRDRLDQLNITERIIYPGLDGLCTWLKRWYYSK